MRVLFVTPFAPSRQRPSPYNQIRRLARAHEVVLVSLYASAKEERELESLKPFCRAIHPVRLSRRQAALNCARFLPSATPLFAGYFHSRELAATAERLLREQSFDLLHAMHIRAAALVAHLEGVPKVLDAQDCMTMLMERHWRSRPGPARQLLYWTEWLKMRRYEPRVCRGFDRIAVCSAVDRRVLEELDRSLDVRLLYNGVDLEHFAPTQEEREACSLVFTGRLSYYPNRDAVSYLHRAVLPVVRLHYPAVRLVVVGGGLPARLEAALRADPGVEVVGHADDVRPYLRRATVSVAPMRLGAGTNFKVIEALAMGTPVVTTSQGCAGLALAPGRDLLRADDAAGFAACVCELLGDAGRRRELAAHGRQYVEQHHSWEAIVAQLETIYGELAGGG